MPPLRPSRIVPVLLLALGATAHAAPSDVVMMQQFIVEATRTDQRPWTYLAGPGFEILSRCERSVTEMAANGVLNELPLQQEIVPPAYWAAIPTPMTFILFNRKPEEMQAASLIPDPMHEGVSQGFNWGSSGPGERLLMGALSAADPDTLVTVQNNFGVEKLVDRQGARFFRLAEIGLPLRLYECIPALPQWYQDALVGPCGIYHLQPQPNGLILAAAQWISAAQTEALLKAAKKTKTPPALPPIESLFTEPALVSPTLSPAQMAEAALFLRWGLFDIVKGEPDHRRAFADFVERSRSQPVTEALFRDCFGFGYAEMQARLSRYLPAAAAEPIGLRYQFLTTWPPPRPKLDAHAATAAEIARILGDWERIQGDMEKGRNPALGRLFLDAAGKTLHDSYAKGERDPRLLAVLGMYDYDVGATAEARKILQAATQAGAARPSAYFDYAELCFLAAAAQPAGAQGRFSVAQTAAVLNPLYAGARLARPKAAWFQLISETWARCEAQPRPEHLAIVRAGVKLYPRNAALTLAAARVHAQWGYPAEAEALVEQGLKFADGPQAAALRKIRASLEPNPPAQRP